MQKTYYFRSSARTIEDAAGTVFYDENDLNELSDEACYRLAALISKDNTLTWDQAWDTLAQEGLIYLVEDDGQDDQLIEQIKDINPLLLENLGRWAVSYQDVFPPDSGLIRRYEDLEPERQKQIGRIWGRNAGLMARFAYLVGTDGNLAGRCPIAKDDVLAWCNMPCGEWLFGELFKLLEALEQLDRLENEYPGDADLSAARENAHALLRVTLAKLEDDYKDLHKAWSQLNEKSLPNWTKENAAD